MTRRTPPALTSYDGVHAGIVELLESARRASARAVNALMTATYWEIGRRIVKAEQGGKRRADYGEQLIERLAADLTKRFGRGFGARNLFQMRAFYFAYSNNLQTPSAKFAARQGGKLRTPSAKFDSPKIRQTAPGESSGDSVSIGSSREIGTARISESSSRKSPEMLGTVDCWSRCWAV